MANESEMSHTKRRQVCFQTSNSKKMQICRYFRPIPEGMRKKMQICRNFMSSRLSAGAQVKAYSLRANHPFDGWV